MKGKLVNSPKKMNSSLPSLQV